MKSEALNQKLLDMKCIIHTVEHIKQWATARIPHFEKMKHRTAQPLIMRWCMNHVDIAKQIEIPTPYLKYNLLSIVYIVAWVISGPTGRGLDLPTKIDSSTYRNPYYP